MTSCIQYYGDLAWPEERISRVIVATMIDNMIFPLSEQPRDVSWTYVHSVSRLLERRNGCVERMSVLHLLSYFGILAAAGFVVLSLASGLLWLSELIEEHTKVAKTLGIRAIYAIIAIHIVLYFTDALPLKLILFSVICHGVYLINFSDQWPAVALQSPAFLASCLLAIMNHFLWFFYFSNLNHEARAAAHRGFRSGQRTRGWERQPPGFAEVATFFGLCVWLVPLFLFLSLSANDNALPVSSEGMPAGPMSRTSLFRTALDCIPFLRRKKGNADGILITHSPKPSAPNTPVLTSYSGHNISSLHNSSPRSSFESPNPDYTLSRDGLGLTMGVQTRFTLRPPPKRTQTESSGSTVSSQRLGPETSLRRKARAD